MRPTDGNPNIFRKFYQYYEDGFNEKLRASPDAKIPLRPMPQLILPPDP